MISSTSTQTRPTPLAWFGLASLALIFVAVAWIAREPGVTNGNDDALYILLSRALRQGTYSDLYQVEQGWHFYYPPGYPAFLALFAAIFGERFDLFIALNILLTLAAIGLVADAARRLWSHEVALAVLVLSVFNFAILNDASTWIRSEALYMGLTALALWALATHPPPSPWTWVAIVAACLAALTRSVGVTVVAAVGTAFVMERRWKAFARLAAVACMTVVPWQVWTLIGPKYTAGGSYADDVTIGVGAQGPGLTATIVGRVKNNAIAYATVDIPDALGVPSIEGMAIDNALLLAVWGALAVVGFVALWKRWRVAAVYVAYYGGVLLIWPFHLIRFLTPNLPILFLAIAAGAWEAGGRLVPARRWIPLVAITALLSVTGVARQGQLLEQRMACDRSLDPPSRDCVPAEVASFLAAARFARTSLPPAAIVVAGKDAAFAYLSGRRTLSTADVLEGPVDSVRERLRNAGVDYLYVGRVHIADPRLARALLPVCSELDLVGAFEPHSYLFRFHEPGAPAPDGDSACGPLGDEAAQAARDAELQ